MTLLLLLACTGEPAVLDTAADTAPPAAASPCNPVDETACLLPFPSDFLMEPDGTSPTGLRVKLRPEALPVNIDGARMEPGYWNELDGWSSLGELVAGLPTATLEGVIGWQDLGAYLDADARTVVVDRVTGQRVPHFVERDVFSDDPARRLLVLRPVSPMQHATTYVVGIRGLVDEDGAPVPAPAGFAALRDGAASDDPAVEAQRDRYDTTVFPTLEAQGFARDELQLAWSFTTVSKEQSLGRATWLRDDALAWVEEEGLSYTLDAPDEEDCAAGATIGRTLTGSFTAPLYLEADEPGTVLTRDADGWPYRNGTTEVPFTLRIPCTVLAADQPAGFVQFGHGLLGNQGEVYSSSLSTLASAWGQVLGAVDWTGMKEDDRLAITEMILQAPGDFAIIPERLMQGYVEQALFARLVTGPLSRDPLFTTSLGRGLVDPARLAFYGISQGAVLGGGFGALSTDHTQVVLTVPGTPFTLLLARSDGFSPFLLILDGMYDDPADVSIIIALMQSLWDPGEAAGYARFMNGEPLDDHTPAKDVLMVAGLGDALVPALGAHVMARAYGAQSIQPVVRSVWGIPEAAPPFTGSAFVELDYGYDDPVEAVPADVDNGVHWAVPGEPQVIELIGTWLTTGQVVAPCDGPCDPD